MPSLPDRIPVLLLKTKSTPNDSYEEYFSDKPFTPTFVPVLEHRPNLQNLDLIHSLLLDGKFGRDDNAKYGGMIFTSQRAVEGFAKVVDEVEAHRNEDTGSRSTHGTKKSSTAPFPLYVVGPATSRTLTSVLSSSCRSPHSILSLLTPQIFGSHAGNGEVLAHYILEHYHSLPGPTYTLPLLFLVGEQRRDIIPKTLMDPSLPEDKRISVDELVVYETGVMESFAHEFASHTSKIESNAERGVAVVVVFSPSGCEAMLRCLGYIDSENKLTEKGRRRGIEASDDKGLPETGTRYVVATIGPTTRDYLQRQFGFEADVCAETPSPQGVGEGVKKFLERSFVQA